MLILLHSGPSANPFRTQILLILTFNASKCNSVGSQSDITINAVDTMSTSHIEHPVRVQQSVE